MTTATLSSKYQISVPKEVRDALGSVPGQKLAFINTGTGVRLVPQPTVAELIGIARGADTHDYRDRTDTTSPGAGAKGSRSPRRRK